MLRIKGVWRGVFKCIGCLLRSESVDKLVNLVFSPWFGENKPEPHYQFLEPENPNLGKGLELRQAELSVNQKTCPFKG